MTEPETAVRLSGITKLFGGQPANDDVSFEARKGEVHALLGENGAGKSTLCTILTGIYRPDAGTIEVFGQPMELTPSSAVAAGIGMVHQHFRLVPNLSVTENIILGDKHGAGSRFLLDRQAAHEQVADLSRRYRLDVDPRARIDQLSVGEQQRVEILKALYHRARILILDEPTTVLTPHEVSALFQTVRAMADEGETVIFICHKLYEVMEVADRVTVLRKGRTVATRPMKGLDDKEIVRLMIGRDLNPVRRQRGNAPKSDELVLAAEELHVQGDRGEEAVRGVSFELRAGEILAVAGVAGNGQHELAEALTGNRIMKSGAVLSKGRLLKNGDTRSASKAGIAYCPADRLGVGLAPGLPVSLNSVLGTLGEHSAGPVLKHRSIRDHAAALVKRHGVKTESLKSPVRNLSGGNLQKLLAGRELHGEPRVLVIESPTQGLDKGAADSLHRELLTASERGTAILMISPDLEEVFGLSDRIAVMSLGRIAGEFDTQLATPEEVGRLMSAGRK